MRCIIILFTCSFQGLVEEGLHDTSIELHKYALHLHMQMCLRMFSIF